METLLSVIQRAWSQLEIDVNMIVDGLGEPEAMDDHRNNTMKQLLYNFIKAGSAYTAIDPTDIYGSTLKPVLNIDMWCRYLSIR